MTVLKTEKTRSGLNSHKRNKKNRVGGGKVREEFSGKRRGGAQKGGETRGNGRESGQ